MVSEFDRTPVAPKALQSGQYFAASYAGEHVAGTEFVIGALFVSFGLGAMDVIVGLVFGNLLAVLTWALLCAPIATDTRLTLYAYLEKIAGPHFIKIYSVVNGALFCILAGAMITVSASAIRILFGLDPQTGLFPTDLRFILIALSVGMVVAFAAVKGFKFVAKFAEVAAPWMISMFFIGALATLPALISATPDLAGVGSSSDLMTLLDKSVFVDRGTEITVWHVIAFTWGANLAFHGGLGDMTILRFAKNKAYGWYSSLGMFIGHFAAWIAAGIMGAGAASILNTPLTELDAGGVAYQALGAVGILAVVIAGWTTSNPTIYLAGLAFQSLNPKWSRESVTWVVGIITAVIACSPFVFSQLLGFLGIMAVIMAPIGAIIFAEHYLFRPLGLTRYWRIGRGNKLNVPATLTWFLSALCAYGLGTIFKIHIFFLFIPTWIIAMVLYVLLAYFMGAKSAESQTLTEMEQAEIERKRDEAKFIATLKIAKGVRRPPLETALLAIAAIALLVGFYLGFKSSGDAYPGAFKTAIILPTLIYFAAAITLVFIHKDRAEDAN
ncbi:MAG: nucleoside transporter [Acidimicrobiales bacterium]|nr:MAG: nucleoside transporter [Acidimicrobiales bacterium]